MSGGFWLLSVLAVVALVVIFYSAWRKDGASRGGSKQIKQSKEPGFSSRQRGAEKNTGTAVKENSGDAESVVVAEDDKPQGLLVMESVAAPAVPPPPPQLFPLEICYAVRLFGRNLSAAAIYRLRDTLHQKRRYYVLAYDSDSGSWRVNPEQSCDYWLLATPLADRGGAIVAADIRRLEEKARAFAQKEKMNVEFSPVYEALENAARIDRFCEKADRVIELRLYGSNISDGRAVDALQLAGLIADADGKYYVLRERSEMLFRAKLMPTPASGERRALIFEMDAPNVSAPPMAFDKMLQTARRAAQILNMQISDPRGEPIDDERAVAMRQQLEILSEQMRAFGAEPGGMIARLIFT